MTSRDKIIEYISRTVSLTEQEAEVFADSFREVKIRKRQFIVQPNFVVRSRNFVINGAFRAYVVDDKLKMGIDATDVVPSTIEQGTNLIKRLGPIPEEIANVGEYAGDFSHKLGIF